MRNFTLYFKIVFCISLIALFSSFTLFNANDEDIVFVKTLLNKHFDSTDEVNKVKRYELSVTDNGFCRFKKFYTSGKTEYFAFKFTRLKEIQYSGTQEKGKLIFLTKNDDVIVQTHRRAGGDIDTMATFFVLPVINMEAEDLNSLNEKLKNLSNSQ